MSHPLILDRHLPASALWLYVVVCDQPHADDGYVHLSQPALASRAGWNRRCRPGSGARRLRRAMSALVDAGWVDRATTGSGRRTLTQYRERSAFGGEGFEQLPRAVFDVLSGRQDADVLLVAWLRWRLEANRGTGRGWTDLAVSSFAYRYGYKRATAEKYLAVLVDLGLVLTHTGGDGRVVVRFPEISAGRMPAVALPDAGVELVEGEGSTCPGVRIEPHGGLAEASAQDLPQRPTVFRPHLDQELNQDFQAPVSNVGAPSLPGAADKPPSNRKELIDQARQAADRIVRESPQLWVLEPKTRGKIRQGIIRTWCRWSDRRVEDTITAVVAELQLAVEDGRLERHDGSPSRSHMTLIRQVLQRWDSDRIAAPAGVASGELQTRATGPSLAEIAGRDLAPLGAVDDLDAVLQQLQIRMARQVQDEMILDPELGAEVALGRARTAMRAQVADQHRSLVAVAAAKVRTACWVSAQQALDGGACDDVVCGEVDPEVLAMAVASLAEASARPVALAL